MAGNAGSDIDLADRVGGLIDLTDLADDHAPDGIETLCDRAREHRTAAVCVLKPSGGIRTVADARLCLGLAAEVMGDEWATPATLRFGASGLLDDVLGVLGKGGGESATSSY